jgi:hypothetical protein
MSCTYDGNWLHAASDLESEYPVAASIALLARLHDQVVLKEADLLAPPGGGSPLLRHVTAQRASCAWAIGGRSRPLLRRGGRPPDPGRLVLHHGSPRAMVQGSYWDEPGVDG